MGGETWLGGKESPLIPNEGVSRNSMSLPQQPVVTKRVIKERKKWKDRFVHCIKIVFLVSLTLMLCLFLRNSIDACF